MIKIGFNVYDYVYSLPQSELTVEEAGLIVLSYAERKDVSTAKTELSIPRDIIESTYKDISEVESTVIKAMRGESKIQLATYDEYGNEITPDIYNTIPVTLDELKELIFNLIARDFVEKVQGSYSIEDVEELRIKVYFCVDKIIEYSKSTKDGDWTFFSQQF